MNHILAVGIPLVFLGLFAASIWYVSFRLRTLFGFVRRWPLRLGVAAVVTGAATSALGTAKLASPLVGTLNVFGGFVLILYAYLLLALLGLHAIQLRWKPPPRWSGIAALVAAIAATAAGGLRAGSFSVEETEIRLPHLDHEVTLMQISDVHLGHHRGRAYLAAIVEETNRRRPDLVLITGDLLDSAAAFEPGVLDPLSQLTAPAFFVGGNHEKYVDEQRAFELVARQGVRVLRNDLVETQGLQLVGLDYLNADEDTFDLHPSDDPRTVKSVLAELPLASGAPSVLMQHSPAGAQYVAAKGIGLMISGHTHGGQVFPATLIAELVFRFSRGLHREDSTAVFVSQGAGTFVARARLGSSNEINLLRLEPASPAGGTP